MRERKRRNGAGAVRTMEKPMITPFLSVNYLDKKETEHWSLFEGLENVWEVLNKIGPYLEKNLKPGRPQEYPGAHIGPNVFISPGVTIEPGALIKGPAWIGPDCRIGPSAF